MKEIGGYFGLDEYSGSEYYKDLVSLNTARNALLYVLKARKIAKLYVPYYLCDTVSEICKKYNYDFEYYHTDENFRPVFEKVLNKDEYLYVVNYFGQISNEEAVSLKAKYGNIIFDNVQAFFQKPVQGINTIYSCRKFFGVPDGAYLSTDVFLDEELPVDFSADRMKHILGRYEKTASEYYGDFQQNDESFYELELKQMSRLTHNLLKAVDYDRIKNQRTENFNYLYEKLGKKNKLNLIKVEGAYCYPFYCGNGMQIKKKLAAEKIFIPTLWPNVLDMDVQLEKEYSENILLIPCDQRYGVEEMKYISESIMILTKI